MSEFLIILGIVVIAISVAVWGYRFGQKLASEEFRRYGKCSKWFWQRRG